MKKYWGWAVIWLIFCMVVVGMSMAGPPGAPGPGPDTDLVVRSATIGTTYRLNQYTVATLPATPTEGDRAEIIDGASTTDCTVGGGTDIVTCRYNGAAWANVGDGQAAGSAEVQNEAYSALNFDGDVTHAPTQDIFYDFWHLIDTDDDGVITDSELSLAGLTLTGANGLTLGVAGSVQGVIKMYSNVADNPYYFTLFSGAEFTENVGFRPPVSMPTGLNFLLNVDVTTGQMDYTDPATFLLKSDIGAAYDTAAEFDALFAAKQDASSAATDTEVAALQTDDLWTLSGLSIGALNFGAFTGATIADNQTLKTILQSLETAIEGISVGGLADLDDLPGDTVDDNLIDFALLAAITSITPVDTADENAAFYPLLVDGVTGTQVLETDGELSYNPSTGRLTVPIVYAGAIESSAAAGTHYIEADNGATAITVDATLGRLAFYDGEWRFANGTNWTADYLLRYAALGANVFTFLGTPSSANLLAAVTNETGSSSGTPLLVFNQEPVIVNPTVTGNIYLETAGVTFGASNGTLTITGNGDGYDENLSINFNAVENAAVISSPSSGMTMLSFSGLSLATDGIITGRQSWGPAVTTSTAHDTSELHSVMYDVTATSTVTLDAAADAGFGACARYEAVGAVTVTLDLPVGEKIRIDGTALAAGVAVVSSGVSGDYAWVCASTDTDGSGTDGYVVMGHRNFASE